MKADKEIKTVNNYVVTQHNSLVEANYSNNLSARSLKVARLLISSLSPNTEKFESITIEISALKAFLGYSPSSTWGRFHDDLKDIAKRLNSEPIEIQLAKGKTLVSFFIASYIIDIPKGKVSFDLSSKLTPYLLQLKQGYTSYLLINARKLRSVYSIRLYELLHQYRKFGKRSFDLEDLQKKVGSNYKVYGNFKARVILQAQADLKMHTDLAFVFDERKEGRRVAGIEFIIFGNKPEKNEPNQLSFLDDAIEFEDEKEKPALSEVIIEAMNEIGISEQNIAKYLALGFDIIDGDKKKRQAVETRCKTLENYYLEKLELTKYSNASSSGNNAAGFFIKALKQDWANSQTLKRAKQQEAAKKRLEATKMLEASHSRIERLSVQRDTVKSPIIEELIKDEALLQTAYDETLSQMGNFMKKHVSDVLHLPLIEQYKKTPSFTYGINQYFLETYPERFGEVMAIIAQIEREQEKIKLLKKEYPYL